MYVLHYRRRRNRLIIALSAVLLVGLGAGMYYSRGLLKTDNYIGPAPAAVYTTVADNRPKTKKFDEKLYSFELPKDWESFTIPHEPNGALHWRNTKDNISIRTITIYKDYAVKLPPVNRALPVTPTVDHFVLSGDVSENCLSYTKPTDTKGQTDAATEIPAKWQAADFMCATGTKFQNVVGVAAAGQPLGVELTGAANGKQKLYITYEDNSSNFDASVFIDMVKSFRVK